MTTEHLREFKKYLEDERAVLLDKIRSVTRSYTQNENKPIDEIDIAAEGTTKDLGIHLNNRENLYLRKILEALHRIQMGRFGICSSCEEEIDLRRLKARPTASLCVKCKEEQERQESTTVERRKFNSMVLGK